MVITSPKQRVRHLGSFVIKAKEMKQLNELEGPVPSTINTDEEKKQANYSALLIQETASISDITKNSGSRAGTIKKPISKSPMKTKEKKGYESGSPAIREEDFEYRLVSMLRNCKTFKQTAEERKYNPVQEEKFIEMCNYGTDNHDAKKNLGNEKLQKTQLRKYLERKYDKRLA